MSFLQNLFGPPDVGKMKAKRDINGLLKALDYKKKKYRTHSEEYKYAKVRGTAIEALGELGEVCAVEPIIAALVPLGAVLKLDYKDTETKATAAASLGQIGAHLDNTGPRASIIKVLIGTLEESDNKVGKAAEDALVKIGSPAVEPLIASLGERRVRKSAVAALIRIGTPAMEPLSAALTNADILVRESAANALKTLNWKPAQETDRIRYWAASNDWAKCIETGKPAIGALIPLLKDGDWKVRLQVAGALGQIGARLGTTALGVRAVKALVGALGDEDEWVRNAAGEALSRTNWKPGQDENGAVYWAANHRWDKCIEIGANAIQPLTVVIKNSLPEVSEAAAEALGRICAQLHDGSLCASAVPALMDAFRKGNKSAADVLGKIGAPAVSPLILELKDEAWSVRKTAATTLVKLYQSGLLDKSHKDLILVHRDSISAKHNDGMEHSDYQSGPSDDDRSFHSETEHADNGIGVRFPL